MALFALVWPPLPLSAYFIFCNHLGFPRNYSAVGGGHVPYWIHLIHQLSPLFPFYCLNFFFLPGREVAALWPCACKGLGLCIRPVLGIGIWKIPLCCARETECGLNASFVLALCFLCPEKQWNRNRKSNFFDVISVVSRQVYFSFAYGLCLSKFSYDLCCLRLWDVKSDVLMRHRLFRNCCSFWMGF